MGRMDEATRAFNFLTDKPVRKRTLWRPRRKWEDNIRMYLKDIDMKTRKG